MHFLCRELTVLSIVSSNATLVKNAATSNDTILYPSGTFCFWVYLANSLVLLIVNSDLLNGAIKLARYFTVSYVAVKLQCIGKRHLPICIWIGIIERVKDHGVRDTKSHVLKHSSEKEHVGVHRKTLKLSAVISKTTDSKRRSLRHY